MAIEKSETPPMDNANGPAELSPDGIDRWYRGWAVSALQSAGISALDFLAANPTLSTIELARRLADQAGRNVNAVGLIIAIYEEAQQKGCLRETARDMLVRALYDASPNGWSPETNMHHEIAICSWSHCLKSCSPNRFVGEYATRVFTHLAFEHAAYLGWTPLPQNDPLIDELFDRYWPACSDNPA
jgi:hypothetical protein